VEFQSDQNNNDNVGKLSKLVSPGNMEHMHGSQLEEPLYTQNALWRAMFCLEMFWRLLNVSGRRLTLNEPTIWGTGRGAGRSTGDAPWGSRGKHTLRHYIEVSVRITDYVIKYHEPSGIHAPPSALIRLDSKMTVTIIVQTLVTIEGFVAVFTFEPLPASPCSSLLRLNVDAVLCGRPAELFSGIRG
jgi:hypothetical protein